MNTNTLFPLGRTVATRGVLAAVPRDELDNALRRHMRGDWGDLDKDDARSNDYSVENGCRILSAYLAEDGTKFWIITEADRSVTTFLLPSEY